MGQAAEHEAEWIRRIARGDEAALHEFYLAYYSPLRRFLWHQMDGNEAAIEDLLQEVFIAVWQAASTYRGQARVATWIFQIAHHRLAHLRRDLARRPEGHQWHRLHQGHEGYQDDDPSGFAAPTTRFEDVIVDSMLLTDALDRLSAKHREILELIFLNGFTPAETAVILGVPEGTVKSRVSYARRALAEILQDLDTQRPKKEARG